MNIEKYNKSSFKADLRSTVMECEAMRQDTNNPVDITLGEYVKKKYDVDLNSYMEELGIDVSRDTVNNIFTQPPSDTEARWLVPEIYRSALRLGMRKAPIYGSVIIGEQGVAQTTFKVPHWNMSDATPEYVGEAETIKKGNVSFGQKTMEIRKMGKGITIPYEVKQYVPINIVGIYLQDFGIKLGMGLDNLAIDCLINGEQLDGSESCAVIGVATTNTLAYKDLLKVWVRLSRLGRMGNTIIAGETMAIDTLDLAEFKDRKTGTTDATLLMKSPIPTSVNYFVHGSVPSNQSIIVDSSATMIKYNAQPLLVESEKIVSNQTESTYASLTSGFGIVYRDGRIIVDRSINISGNNFPTWMDADTAENSVNIE